MSNEDQAAGTRSRRQILRLVGVGGVLGAAGAAGVVGIAAAAGTQPERAGSTSADAFPTGGITVILAVPDAGEAREFYQAAFAAETLVAARDREGRIFHAELLINGNLLAVATENPAAGLVAPRSPESAMWLAQFVPDLEVAVQRAESAGALLLQKPVALSDFLAHACVRDVYGHNWQTFQSFRSFTAEELQQTIEDNLLGLN